MTHLHCSDEARRQRIQSDDALTGLDYIIVGADPVQLKVVLLGHAPREFQSALEQQHVAILVEGGRRITDIHVDRFELVRERARGKDDYLLAWLNKRGDSSLYTLRLVRLDDTGQVKDEPPPGIDVRYDTIEFSFDVDQAIDLDCKKRRTCPPKQYPQPDMDYLAKDYASFRRLILDRLALIMPDWQEHHIPDIGITLVELLAYTGDYLSYYQDAVATEAYLATARQRISVRRHVRLVDYPMHEGCNSRAWLHLDTETDTTLDLRQVYFITAVSQDALPDRNILSEDDLRSIPPGEYEVFEPVTEQPVHLYHAHNEITFYTWGNHECCLAKGATSATLMITRQVLLPQQDDEAGDQSQKDQEAASPAQQVYIPPPSTEPDSHTGGVQVGDVLLFEEVKNPKTDRKADRDLLRRHIVRLTGVFPVTDHLFQPESQPSTGGKEKHAPDTAVYQLVEVEWANEDALPFSLCISAIGPAPKCELLNNISVARGNMVLVDHGRTLDREVVGPVPARALTEICKLPPCDTAKPLTDPKDQKLVDVVTEPARFRPVLAHGPLTFTDPVLPEHASRRQDQQPRNAIPALRLHSIPVLDGFAIGGTPIPLFNPYEMQHPKQLIGKLHDLKDPDATPPKEWYRLATLYRKLSHHTQQLIHAYNPEDDASVELEHALSAELAALCEDWQPRRDLIGSGPQDRHYVVEMDNEGIAHLRFGDGELGRMPAAGTVFLAEYRVGNGTAGNVGAEAIQYVVYRTPVRPPGDLVLKPHNPLPARSGTDPEPISEVKRYAPYAFRTELKRAITPDDYAQLAQQHPKVQRAFASLRWTGSWYEMRVAVDVYGGREADKALLAEVDTLLAPYTRIGHRLRVVSAKHVPLDIFLRVQALPYYLRGHIKAELLERFSTRVLPDGSLGFFHPDNLTFGTNVHLSKIVAVAQRIEGVAEVEVTTFKRWRQHKNMELELGVLVLAPDEIACCENDLNRPEYGMIDFLVEGGQ